MNPIEAHLCLVSAQPVPNLTPALDRATAPRRVILLVSRDMRQRAGWLEQVLAPRGIRVERWEIDDPWDLEAIQTRVLELLEKERNLVDGRHLALNATGGTKPMSIAAYEACRAYNLPVFYVHPERDRLIWLHPEKDTPRELEDRIRLEAFLQAHGARHTGELQRSLPGRRQLETAESVIRHIDRYSRALARLNWAAGTARRKLVSDPLDNAGHDLVELIGLFEQGGFLRREGKRLRFPDETARFYVNGGWMEGYVFNRVRRLRGSDPHIQDMAHGVEVTREQRHKRIPNELDVVFLRNNRLHVIECKTRRFQPGGGDSPGAGALYKLDSLRDLMGGLQARAMLVSFQNLPDHDRTRAADLGIQVCAGEQLDHLGRYLKEFTA